MSQLHRTNHCPVLTAPKLQCLKQLLWNAPSPVWTTLGDYAVCGLNWSSLKSTYAVCGLSWSGLKPQGPFTRMWLIYLTCKNIYDNKKYKEFNSTISKLLFKMRSIHHGAKDHRYNLPEYCKDLFCSWDAKLFFIWEYPWTKLRLCTITWYRQTLYIRSKSNR